MEFLLVFVKPFFFFFFFTIFRLFCQCLAIKVTMRYGVAALQHPVKYPPANLIGQIWTVTWLIVNDYDMDFGTGFSMWGL